MSSCLIFPRASTILGTSRTSSFVTTAVGFSSARHCRILHCLFPVRRLRRLVPTSFCFKTKMHRG